MGPIEKRKAINNTIMRMGLTEHKNKTSETLSGGNKRKL
jgi:ABC-type multidrug transport system ATPase subunit